MMKQDYPRRPTMKSRTDLKRRNFLLSMGAGGAGAVAVLAGGKAALDSVGDKAAQSDAGGKGYRVSDHVRSYYRTARV
jgi:hypothetical protein